MVPYELVTGPSLPVHTDGHSMWASVQKEPPPREPNYSSIEQLFCLPVTEPKDKGAAAPVKKEAKEVLGQHSTRLLRAVSLGTNANDYQS